MPTIATSPILGKLEPVEVYQFYDRPILFSCRKASGEYYLVVLIKEEADADTWLYVAMSQRRFTYVRSGGIDLKDAFLKAEDGVVLQVKTLVRNGESTLTPIPTGQLTPEMLPAAGSKLDLATETLPGSDHVELPRLAQQTRRHALELKLKFPLVMRNEAPSRLLGQVLESLQDTVNAIGQTIGGKPTRRGTIAPEILNQTELSVVATFPGSFGVQLVVSQVSDMYDHSLGGDALEKLIALFALGSNRDALRVFLRELKTRSASKYRRFLQLLAQGETGLALEWASPKPGKLKSASVTPATAQAAMKVVAEITSEMAEPQEVLGKLTMINSRRMTFTLEDLEERNRRYSGKILPEARIEKIKPKVPNKYVATLIEIIEVSATGEENVKWLLSKLVPISAASEPPREI